MTDADDKSVGGDEESKLSQSFSHHRINMIDTTGAGRSHARNPHANSYQRLGGGRVNSQHAMSDYENDLENGGVSGRKRGVSRDDEEFRDLELASSDGEGSVISMEQVNQENFRCISLMRPVFWLAYYLFCCCVIGAFTR